jgi:hypothetical protein
MYARTTGATPNEFEIWSEVDEIEIRKVVDGIALL